MTPLRIFIGYDERAPIQYHVLCHSILKRASLPISITPLILETLPITRRGLTKFTYSRFLVPWLCDFNGQALFLDSDQLVLGDVAELFDYADDNMSAVYVRKSYLQFEWASVMLFNCAHVDNQILTPDYVGDEKRCKTPHLIDWCSSGKIGDLPPEWNYLCLYEPPPDTVRLVHFTGGIPLFQETRGCPGTDEWMVEANEAMSTVDWKTLMGRSVHVQAVEHFQAERASHSENAPSFVS